MKIAFDVDGVVLRSIDVILDYINRVANRNLRVDDLTAWDLEPLNIDLRTLHAAVQHMYAQPSVENYSGAVEVLSRIYQTTRDPLLFITGRADPETALRQLQVLPWNPTVPEMVVTGGTRDKRAYLAERAVDFIVEDDPAYLQAYLDAGFGVGLMLRPWNRQSALSVTRRFEGWQDVELWFSGLREQS
ncbi:MAG: hypothetical protein HY914_03075 [Desulfomonile tiedjei]|nr:hypothetical protein [Desulfomonile tiedjei]